MVLIKLCTETLNFILRGTNSDGCGIHQYIVYILYVVVVSSNRMTGNGRGAGKEGTSRTNEHELTARVSLVGDRGGGVEGGALI